METARFAKLERLLTQSELYTSFLSEQIESDVAEDAGTAASTSQACTGACDGPETPAAEVTKDGAQRPAGGSRRGKRTRGGRPKAADTGGSNVVMEAAKTPTQRLLPMMTLELRDYQLKGVRWLTSMWSNGLNGILADQMGLGKTIQTIGFLSHLKGQGINGPFLVVAPLSTLANWIAEFSRSCPGLPTIMYHGSRAERDAMRAGPLKLSILDKAPPTFPVMVTSYEIVIADSKHLQRYNFKFVVVDEGHRLKNFDCRLIRELRLIPAANRLLLTGTPLQNNLAELWSLLNFIMPDVFSKLADFQDWFESFETGVGRDGADEEVIAAEQRHQVVSKLHAIMRPFVLRRLKSDVCVSLPPKAELLLYAPLSTSQQKLTAQLLDGTLKVQLAEMAEREGGPTAANARVNNVLMQMRKIANHPDLLTSSFTSDVDFPSKDEILEQSGKMRLLERLLGKLRAGGHKVLIFSQMTKMLDLIQSYLEQTGRTACRIDGSVPWQERQRAIDDFNSDPDTWLFLLSTRAGGLGINLTAADTVIIYDSDWNPHQDLQAMDRCHRIGQARPVLVFRLAASHSVEGRMLRAAAGKMALERLVIKKGAFGDAAQGSTPAAAMSTTELLDLLRSDIVLNDVTQSAEVDDSILATMLDRRYMSAGVPCPFPPSGVGYELVQAPGTAGLTATDGGAADVAGASTCPSTGGVARDT